jgi:hypothetical protein
MTDNASSDDNMAHKLQSTLKACGIEWPPVGNHMPCMTQIIQLALEGFISIFNVKGHTKTSEVHEPNQQFGGNKSIATGKSKRLQTENNARIKQVSAMRPDSTLLTEKYIHQTIWKVLKPTVL